MNALYARHQEDAAQRFAQATRHAVVEDVLESVAGRELQVQEAFGVPVGLAWGPYFIDVRRDSLTPVPRDGKSGQVAHHVRLLSTHGSILESVVWEEVFANIAASAVKVIQAASLVSIPVLTINAGGSTSALTGYSQAALEDMQQALGAGWQVTAPQRPVTFAQYADVEAYLLLNPVTGAGANKIGALLNGGVSAGPTADNRSECPTCAQQREPINSSVNFATGNLLEMRTDLTLPGVGLPIVFSRTYASRAELLTELGYGWMHSYGLRLRLEPNGDVTWFNEDLIDVRFTKVGTTFTSPAGWQYTLTLNGGVYRLRHKSGLVWNFDSAGRLTSLVDTSGNSVTLVYSGNQLTQVRDALGAVALTFSYTADKLTRVDDSAGRHVEFGYTGDDLTSAKDMLGHSETYGYDVEHNLTSRTDKRGSTYLSFYDFQDRWVGARDALGQESQLVHDAVNRRAVYFDRAGAARAYEFTPGGSPASITDAAGNRTEMFWDAAFNNTQVKDGRGLATTMTHDVRGNVLTRSHPDGRVDTMTYEATFSNVLTSASTGIPATVFTYDTSGRLQTRTPPGGIPPTTYGYDPRGQLRTVTEPGSAVTTFSRDTATGNVTSILDPTNRTTGMGYDPAGHLTSTTDGANKTRRLEVDDAGRVTAMVDALQNRTESTYDDEGLRRTSKDALGKVTTFNHDANGWLTSVEDALGNVSRTEYDAEGRVTATVDAKGNRTTRKYDAAGRLLEVTDAAGFTTTQAYCADVATSPCAEVNALGHLTTRTFDTAGRVLTETDDLGRVSKTTYDSAGRTRTRSGPMQVPTTYVYNGGTGRLDEEQTPTLRNFIGYDDRNNRTAYAPFSGGFVRGFSWTYDLANRVLTETNGLNQQTVFTYDNAGRRATKLDGNLQLTNFGYDDNGRRTSETFSDGTKNEWAFDSRGNRTLEKSPNHERHLLFDELGRLKQVDDITFGRTIVYGYDANGNRTSITEGGVTQRFEYDSRNLLISAREGSSPAVQLKYDALGRRTAIIRPNGVRSDFVFDDASQVSSITHSKGGVALLAFSYQHDDEGMRTRKTREDGTFEQYGYDTSRRLTSVKYSSGRNISYGLDVWGNWLDVFDSATPLSGYPSRYTTNAFNQVTRIENYGSTLAAFTYDNNGNTLTEVKGASFGGGTTTYAWTKGNRLASVTTPAGVTTYQYDANGLRTKKNESGTETRFLLEGPSVLQELDGANTTVARYLNNPQRIDEQLAFSRGGADYYPLTDALGSVYALTDSSGAIVRSYGFEVYGERADLGGSGPTTSFGFTGREHDSWGGNYNRDRYYLPRYANFLSADRAGMIDGPNLYGYVRKNPVQFIDPSGRASFLGGVDPFPFSGLLAATGHLVGWARELGRAAKSILETLKAPPNGDTIDGNIEKTLSRWAPVRLFWWPDQVDRNGSWDYAANLSDEELNPFVQANYGATGSAAGYPLNALVFAGDMFQANRDEFYRREDLRYLIAGQFGTRASPYFPTFYLDDPVDTFFIEVGAIYYWFDYWPRTTLGCD